MQQKHPSINEFGIPGMAILDVLNSSKQRNNRIRIDRLQRKIGLSILILWPYIQSLSRHRLVDFAEERGSEFLVLTPHGKEFYRETLEPFLTI